MEEHLEHDGEAPETESYVLGGSARFYDLGARLSTLGRNSDLYRWTADAVEPIDGLRILDVGCGTGLLSVEVARRMQFGGVVGLDASPEMLAVARRKRASPLIRYVLGVAEAMPFDDGCFDAAVSALFFHHVGLGLKRRVAHELFRVLKPGSAIAVCDFVKPWTPFGRFYSRVARALDQSAIGENLLGAVQDSLKEAGFKEVIVGVGALGAIAVTYATKPGPSETSPAGEIA